jgi:hypothetical protein
MLLVCDLVLRSIGDGVMGLVMSLMLIGEPPKGDQSDRCRAATLAAADISDGDKSF